MPKITIYQKPTCSTCRKVSAAIKDSGVSFSSINYYLDPIPKSKIKSLLLKMNISAGDLLRVKDPLYKKLGLGNKNYTQEEVIGLMVKYPDLIQRPIVEKGAKAILARPAERLLEILSASPKKE